MVPTDAIPWLWGLDHGIIHEEAFDETVWRILLEVNKLVFHNPNRSMLIHQIILENIDPPYNLACMRKLTQASPATTIPQKMTIQWQPLAAEPTHLIPGQHTHGPVPEAAHVTNYDIF